MACIAAPLVQAVVTTLINKKVKSNEKKAEKLGEIDTAEQSKIPFSRKLKWLSTMLYGGSALLAFEHVWHGEITAFFPFLTAAQSAESTMAMLQEIATVGVGMSAVVTAVWLGLVGVTSLIEKRAAEETPSSEAAE